MTNLDRGAQRGVPGKQQEVSLTSISLSNPSQDRGDAPFIPAPPPVFVQILGMVLFGIFAIVATVMAFDSFWLAGFALAIILGWRGFGPRHDRNYSRQKKCKSHVEAPKEQFQSSGNTSFDAYRAQVLQRLEDEQKTFVSFMDRLRDAKDKSEFDTFMDDRARATSTSAAPALGLSADTPRAGEY